jgi:23S rRNA pseudouridine1911/1915/1917 synthase
MGLQDSSLQSSWVVTAEYAGLRLDAFLRAQLPFLSRSELGTALQQRLFLLNGGRARKGNRLVVGDTIRFVGPAAWLSSGPIPNPQLIVTIVYEDSHILALNKPAGMNSHGFSGREADSVANFVLARWPQLSSIGVSRWQPGLVHRLDRETSGLLLLAKTQAAFDDLCRQFRGRAVKKRYLALVWGSLMRSGSIDFPLAHDAKDNRKMQALITPSRRPAERKAWPALTRFRTRWESGGLTLLELEMQTGVTHQLRAHLAAIDHPIVADRLYGQAGRPSFELSRHFLHAAELQFVHPESKQPIMLKAPLPEELSRVLTRLKMIADAE